MFMDPKLIHKNSLNIDIVRENRMARQKAKMDEALLSNQNDAATILIRCLQRARQRRIAHDLVREYWDEEIKCLFDLKREPKTQTRLIYLLIRFYDASRDYQRIKHLCSRLLKRDTSNSLFHQLLLSSKNPNDEIKRCALRVVPSFLELVTRGIVGSLCPLSKRIELRLLVAYSDIKLDTFSLKNKINGFLLDSQFNETIAPHLIASIRRLSSTRVSKESHEEKSHLEAYIKGTLFLNLSSTASVSEDVEIEHAILTTILTIPLLSDFLDAQGLRLLSTSFWKQCLKDLSGKLFMSINGEQALFILANFVTFLTKTSAFQADDAAMRDVHIPLIHVLLLICEQFVSESGNGRYVTYHRFFKWYAGKPTDLTDDESNLLFIQLSSLWSRECITCVFGSITYIPIPVEVMDYRLQKKSNSLSRDRLKKMSSLSLLRRRSSVISVKSVSTVNKAETDSNTTLVTSSDTDQHYAAALFPLMMRVFRVQEQSISSALAYTPGTTSKMWQLLTGIYSTTHEMVSHIASQTVKGKRTVVMEMFELFCRSGILLFSTLDDREVYEEERPFRLAELVDMLNFFNQLCYEICLDNSAFTSNTTQSVFVIARKLLLILEEMNSRRSFGHTVWRPQVSWHAVSSRIENRDQEALRILHQMPHLIPFSVRVQVFRMLIKEDQIRVADNRIKTVFKIHRNRVRIITVE